MREFFERKSGYEKWEKKIGDIAFRDNELSAFATG
jgi:hypothetical protein